MNKDGEGRPGQSGQITDATNVSLRIPDLPAGVAVPDAARIYGACGWYVLPVHPDTKHPGSLVGNGWQFQSARYAAQIAAWWQRWPFASLALHVGRSGAVAFDVDMPAYVPAVLRGHWGGMPFQSTRTDNPERGHYLAAAEPGRFGNSYGDLGPGWGDVRGLNGVIIVAPTLHSKAATGGCYRWMRAGALPPIPDALATCLRPPGGTCGTATSGEVAAFLRDLPVRGRP